MENIKKNPLSLQLNADDFLPASNEEKQSLVVMRESVNFWKDGLRRLKKNKIAMVSFVFIIAIAIFAYLLPAVWPYSYSEQMKGSNNLARSNTLPPSRPASTPAKRCSRTFWVPTVWAVTLQCVS